MIKFASPEMLYLLALLPAAAVLVWLSFRRRRRDLAAFGDMRLVEKLAASAAPGKQVTKSVLFLLAMAAFIIAAARPQVGTKMELVKRKGIDIVIAIDTSASMNAEDAMGKSKGRRIEKAVHEIDAMLDILDNDRVGLVAFAGSAHIHCPLTLDYDAVRIFLNVIDTNLVPTPGTNLGAAITKSISMFDKHEKKFKALILITDGEGFAGKPLDVAEKAAKEGVRIFPIGIGSPQGTPIPVYDENGEKIGLKKDKDGNLVLSKLDEVTLEKIALKTGGRYFPASLGEIELKKIHSEISSMEKKELATRKYTHFEDRFQWLIGLGLLLLLLESLITTRSSGNGGQRRFADEKEA